MYADSTITKHITCFTAGMESAGKTDGYSAEMPSY